MKNISKHLHTTVESTAKKAGHIYSIIKYKANGSIKPELMSVKQSSLNVGRDAIWEHGIKAALKRSIHRWGVCGGTRLKHER